MSDVNGNDGIDLNALFPNLAPVLNAFDNQPAATNDALTADPAHGGVTDEAVQAFISQRYGRVGPQPIVSNQQPPPVPEFRSGQGAPPPVGGVEGSDGTTTQTAPGQLAPDDEGLSSGAFRVPAPQPAPPAPDDGSQPPETGTETVVEDDGPVSIDRQRFEAWNRFDELLDQDPRLRQLITTYLVEGRVDPGLLVEPSQPIALVQPQPVQQQPVGPTLFAPIQPPDDLDLDDPAVAALWQVVQNQNQQLGLIATQIAQQQEAQLARQQTETQSLVNRAVSSFQQQRQLDDQMMAKVRDTAARLNLVPAFMSGRDPFTGAPVKPDPLAAIERSLEIAYFQLPETREAEAAKMAEQARQDRERKAKIGALSGNSGSSPRTQPAPTNAEERRAAMVGEVASMLNGSWNGEGN